MTRAPSLTAIAFTFGACAMPDTRTALGAPIRAVDEGAVYASEPGRLADVRALDSLRIRTVLDLDDGRVGEPGNQVERDWQFANARGIRFIHLPLPAATPPSLEQLEWAVNALRAPWTRPILVRSDHGAERTLIVVAAYRIDVQRWSADSAYREMIPDSTRDARFADWRARLREFADARKASR
jgi:protein tyrosine/serine phosphatase